MKRKVIATAVIASMLLTACSGEAEESTNETLEETVAETTVATTETTEQTTEQTTEPVATPTPVVVVEEVENTYTFRVDTFPRMDGSTSLVPLGRTVAAVLLGVAPDSSEVDSMVEFHRTTASFEYLINGDSDILFVAQPNDSVFEDMEEAGFEYQMDEIATEALVFICNSTNPVDSLTIDQIRGIYSGEITNWSEVGGDDQPIVAFQRNPESGSQVMMVETVMGDTPMMEVGEEFIPGAMGGLMEGVRTYDNSANAIGYSVYYYANNMNMADGLKIIKVDGVECNPDTIRSGEYPLLNPYYIVSAANLPERSATNILYNWLLSPEGQSVIDQAGYVSKH